jgi:5-methylcytosine-specific restriction protein A
MWVLILGLLNRACCFRVASSPKSTGGSRRGYLHRGPSAFVEGVAVALRTVQPGLRRAEPRTVLRSVGGSAGRDAQAWRAWYKEAAWVKLRSAVLLRDLYTCARCGIMGFPHVPRGGDGARRLVANHKVPHRGERAMFFDASNLETVCMGCHAGPVQREELAARAR